MESYMYVIRKKIFKNAIVFIASTGTSNIVQFWFLNEFEL